MEPANLAQKAIQAALQEKWNQAIKINENILKTNPQDINALNRLAHAFLKKGDLKKAKKFYNQVLKIDSANLIASRNLEKLTKIRGGAKKKPEAEQPSFLEESGKTKTLGLVKLAPLTKLAQLDIGEKLKINAKKRKISITDSANQYLGAFPDDLSKRLLYLINRGNKYEAFVKLVEKNRLVIFIKELFRSKRNQNLPSFPSSGDNYLTSLPIEEPVRKQVPLEIPQEES